MRLIGDVHGKMVQYNKIVSECSESIQVGDFGAGFVDLPMEGPNHRFIRGNHDDPSICRQHPNWIRDGAIENDVMFIGGAFSIDHSLRTMGHDMWENEENSWGALNQFIDIYEQEKPRVMITHDCPENVIQALFKASKVNSRTQAAFAAMWTIHQPKLWVFGHWHQPVRKKLGNTQFVCLAELEYLDVDSL